MCYSFFKFCYTSDFEAYIEPVEQQADDAIQQVR